jgi:purine-nucleoside phosphorylase
MVEKIQEAVAYINAKFPEIPKIGIILGSGLGEYAESFSDPVIIPYSDIPHFPQSTVVGHKGRLLFQKFNHSTLVAMQGRFHHYEGYTPEQVVFPVRVMGKLGIRRLILTNAAGGINPGFEAGDLMLITDHINFMGMNPLRGPHRDEFGERFPDMTHTYDPEDANVFEVVAQKLNIRLRRGVYIAFSGPSYETPAEIRMARTLGADAVGMSTVPEAIVATQMGIRVSGVSCITNMAAGMSGAKLAHQEVMETANRVRKQFIALIDGVIQQFAH